MITLKEVKHELLMPMLRSNPSDTDILNVLNVGVNKVQINKVQTPFAFRLLW